MLSAHGVLYGLYAVTKRLGRFFRFSCGSTTPLLVRRDFMSRPWHQAEPLQIEGAKLYAPASHPSLGPARPSATVRPKCSRQHNRAAFAQAPSQPEPSATRRHQYSLLEHSAHPSTELVARAATVPVAASAKRDPSGPRARHRQQHRLERSFGGRRRGALERKPRRQLHGATGWGSIGLHARSCSNPDTIDGRNSSNGGDV